MKPLLRPLIIEDSYDDYLLLLRELKSEFEVEARCIDTAEALANALAEQEWDIIISDYVMPLFDALSALKLLGESGKDIPFIIVSGKIGEVVAVEAMRAGANDYIMKGDHSRLLPAIWRELRESEIHRERRRTETKLRKHRAAMEAAMDGIAIIGINQELLYLNKALARIYDYESPEELIGKTCKVLYGNEGCSRMQREILPECVRNGCWSGETRGIRRDGSSFLQEISLTLIEEGEIVCIIRDITERKEAERRLQEQLHFRQALIDAIPAPIFFKDPTGRFLGCNRAFENYSGLSQEQVVGKTIFDMASPAHAEKIITADHDLFTKLDTQIYETTLTFADGALHDVIFFKAPFYTLDNRVGGLVGTIIDITERKQTEEKLRYMSTHDVLTGLYNRAYYQEELERLQQGRHFPVSIVIADIDGLKTINDNHGHSAGDEIIIRAALLLKGAFRAEDVVARIGGDEFAILLPSADELTVREALQRVSWKLKNQNGPSSSIELQLSFGAATAFSGRELESALKHADSLMYRDKAAKYREIINTDARHC